MMQNQMMKMAQTGLPNHTLNTTLAHFVSVILWYATGMCQIVLLCCQWHIKMCCFAWHHQMC